MYPVSREFLDAIRSSHTIEVKASAYLNGAAVAGAEDLLVVDGSIRGDGRSNTRRSLEGLKIASADGSTSTLRDLLTPPGTELQIKRGVRFPSGVVELAPVGRFRVGNVEDDLAQPGVVSVTAPDVTARVVSDRFLTPKPGNVGQTVVQMITDLIQESIPGAKVTDNSGSAATVPSGIVWERERWDAVNDLATSIGCIVYADPEGGFVIDPVGSPSDPAVWTANAGTNAVLLGGTRATTMEGVYNVVVATSSPTDGSAPVYGIAQDTDPNSPTYVSGGFGRVPYFYSSPLFTTNDQATKAAQSILSRVIGKRGGLALAVMVNPALEVADRIDVFLPDGSLQRHVVDSFTLPLAAGVSMTLTTRSTEVVQ